MSLSAVLPNRTCLLVILVDDAVGDLLEARAPRPADAGLPKAVRSVGESAPLNRFRSDRLSRHRHRAPKSVPGLHAGPEPSTKGESFSGGPRDGSALSGTRVAE